MWRLRRCVARLAGLHGIEHARDIAHLARPTFAFVLFVTPRAAASAQASANQAARRATVASPHRGSNEETFNDYPLRVGRSLTRRSVFTDAAQAKVPTMVSRVGG
ncbi:hypothetical protein SAMN02800691_0099 [Luteibacter sp. UNCMF366Tsu5.1]|nr:hypothetical protein SAMN02800691_0099 [Luteibacter sp. UNCMF366Tsu5.1]